jgi:hypothetical protein
VNVKPLRRAMGVIVGSDFSDPTNERLIYLSAAGLGLVGLLLLIGTILWWRRGRQEHPVLAPLEMMGERAWIKAPDSDRRRRLDHVRVDGARAAGQEVFRAEPVDLLELVNSVPWAFDELREPGPVEESVVADPDAVAVEAEGDEVVADEVVADEVVADEVEADSESDDTSVSSDPVR